MKKLAALISLAIVMGVASPLQRAVAHGAHVWFVSPQQNASLMDRVEFVMEAPYAKNRYIHLRITRQGEQKSIAERLVSQANKKYSVVVDVTDWAKGAYRAEVTLLGALVQHPVVRDFNVK